MIKQHNTTDGRFYEIEGKFYPSVTTILEAFPLTFGLREFFQNNTKYEAERIREETALSGSKIHHTIELMLMGREVSPYGLTDEQINILNISEPTLVRKLREAFTEKEDKALKGFKQFFEDCKPEIIENEKIIFSKKHGFAGTLDFVGRITLPATKNRKAKKMLVLLDYKTGKGIYPEYELQVAAYLMAYKEMMKTKYIKNLLRGKLNVGLLHLGVNNKCGYSLKFVDSPLKSFKYFLTVKKMWQFVNPSTEPKFYDFEEVYKVPVKFYNFKTKPEDKK